MTEKKLAANEGIKMRSNYLRGTIREGLADSATGAMTEDDQQLLKFHGTYQQDDRDLRPFRRKHKLEKAYSFMIRVRVPGGVATPKQWLQMDEISTKFANGTIKLTTRQAFQFHGVIKSNLKRTMGEINQAAMDTIAACGDVNRNVMCTPNPYVSAAHSQAMEDARAISAHLTPRTTAYHEIWLDGEKVETSEQEVEPIYGKTYLPRKFKISVAVPPSNDVDIYADCLGFIAIVEDEKVVGYNVTVGGGMGATHGNELTFPRTADVIGFCTTEQVVDVAEKVVMVQRDYGDRETRAHARFKYTVDDHGPEGILKILNEYLGYELEPARPFLFEDNGERYGWVEDPTGNSHFTMYVEGGRVVDTDRLELRTGLREIAKIHEGDFRLTGNQNLIIANITAKTRPAIAKLLADYGIEENCVQSGLRLNALACVSLPTCGLALAEAERYLPSLLTELEESLEKTGLRHDAITIRMTGCPNGCARPYIAELAFVGKGPGRYNILLGGGFHGQRLSKLFRTDVPQEEIKGILEPIFADYAKARREGERFGDFCIRAGYVNATSNGADFHANLKEEAMA